MLCTNKITSSIQNFKGNGKEGNLVGKEKDLANSIKHRIEECRIK